MADQQNVDTNAAREAAMSRVQTQETVFAKLAPKPDAVDQAPKDEISKDGEKQDESKPKHGAQERIVALVHAKKEAEQKAATEAQRADALEAKLNALQAQAKPLEASARPTRSQFASEDDYIDALTTYKADEAIQRREQQQAEARQQAEQAEVASKWEKRQTAALSEITDYADVVGKSEVIVPNHIHQAIVESDVGPHLAYYLALNPDEAKQLASMKPLAGLKRLMAIEAELNAEPAAKEVEKPLKKTKAPEPITPVRDAPVATRGTSESFEEYRKRRQGK